MATRRAIVLNDQGVPTELPPNDVLFGTERAEEYPPNHFLAGPQYAVLPPAAPVLRQILPDDLGTGYAEGKFLTTTVSGPIMVFHWANPHPLTTKGDLFSFDGTSAERLAAGTPGQYLTPDAAFTTGLKWSDLPTKSTGSTTMNQAAYNITTANGVYSDVPGMSVSLPAAGTYLFGISSQQVACHTAGSFTAICYRLFNVTTNTAIPDTTLQGAFVATLSYYQRNAASGVFVITVNAPATIKLQVMRDGATTYFATDVYNDGYGATAMSWVKLS